MAKNDILDYSTTPAENQDVNGVSILGTAKPSNLDDAMRAEMSHIAKGLVSRRVAKDTAYTAVKADLNQLLDFTAEATLTTSAAATLTDGWQCRIYASGGDVTINPNGSETVNGEEFLIVKEGKSGVLSVYDGNFRFESFGGAGGGGSEVSFCAAKNSAQQITTPAVLEFGNEIIDRGGFYDAATYRWTPPEGLYRVFLVCNLSCATAVGAGSSGYFGRVFIRKNGTPIAAGRAELWSPAARAHIVTLTTIVEMNGTDYLDTYGDALIGGANVQVIKQVDNSDSGGMASIFSGEQI